MSEGPGVVDWGVAARTAAAIADPPTDRDPEPGYELARLQEVCAEAIEAASAYSRLAVPADPPAAGLVSRAEWAENALATMAVAAQPLELRLAGEISLPGPLEPVARRTIGIGTGIEAGAAVGYAARRVLGQYDFPLFGERPRRLLFVGRNLDHTRAELGGEPETFLRWIALHETTHVLQLDGVPWLADHLRELARSLLEGAAGGINLGRLGALFGRALRSPREVARELVRGELVGALADPDLRRTLDRLQAAMAVIEGHAEHVMDVCGRRVDPGVGELRERLDARRARGSGLGDVIGRLLGIDLKLRQYRLGKRFWDALAAAGGERLLLVPWSSPEALPDLDELHRPETWLERAAAAAGGAR